jgi:hypothetical protein
VFVQFSTQLLERLLFSCNLKIKALKKRISDLEERCGKFFLIFDVRIEVTKDQGGKENGEEFFCHMKG